MSEINTLALHKLSPYAQDMVMAISKGEKLVITHEGNLSAPWIQDLAETSPNTFAELAVLAHSLKTDDGTGRTLAMPNAEELAQSVQQHAQAMARTAEIKAGAPDTGTLDARTIYADRAGQLQQSAPGIDFANIYQRRAAGF